MGSRPREVSVEGADRKGSLLRAVAEPSADLPNSSSHVWNRFHAGLTLAWALDYYCCCR